MRSAVLVEPEIPENTGFVARLAGNFEFKLRIVNPEFNLSEARKTASRAQEKLREAELFDSVEEALEDLDYVVGTKPGRGKSAVRFQPRKNTSLMLGRESSGLESEELEMCDAVVHISTGSYSSLNLSHASAILMHRFYSSEEKEGMKSGQKEVLSRMLPEKTSKALIESNPSSERVNAIIGELKKSDRWNLKE